MSTPVTLTLAHSPDPDDVFMWWPLTGKIRPDGTQVPGAAGRPVLDTGRFEFRALPADIHVLNRRAITQGNLDITALSVRAYAQVQDRYRLTRCGASFGDGFGPKLVRRSADADRIAVSSLAQPGVRIAIPGRETTAFLLLALAIGPEHATGDRFIEMPFEQIIPAVARGEVDAGLVIHEGQLTFVDAGLELLLDVGAWWKEKTGLVTPLGVNAVRRDLDERFGAGTLGQVGDLLSRSVAYAVERRAESTEYSLPFALANTDRGRDGARPTLDRVDRYCRMYVNDLTVDMGETGRSAITALLDAGARAGVCPALSPIDLL